MPSKFNPGVNKDSDHFTAFNRGEVIYLPRWTDCAKYYRDMRLTWQYGGVEQDPKLHMLRKHYHR